MTSNEVAVNVPQGERAMTEPGEGVKGAVGDEVLSILLSALRE